MRAIRAAEEAARPGVRASIVAPKRGNARGAKGRREVDDGMNESPQDEPRAVPPKATRLGEVRARWAWTEASVWTDRMLTALENGVKGGRWYSLMDKVASEANLYWSAVHVVQNGGGPGVDHVTTEQFGLRVDKEVGRLSETLADGSYRPQVIQRVSIPKPGRKEKRPLGIPTVRDRVVQTAVRNVLEPIFERDFAEHSYGFRPQRSCHDALRRVDQLLKAGYQYVVDVDLKSYFDTIPHERLLQRLGEKVTDGRVLRLVEQFLKQGVMDGLKEWTPEKGSPQGAVISPLLSNVYLDPLDHLMAARGFAMIRYADDFVVLCRTREEAEEALEVVRQWTSDAELTLHPEKTVIVDAAEGFEFLGYHFEAGTCWPRKQSLTKLKETLRAKTKRRNGHSMAYIIADVNRVLRGWFAYYKYSSPSWFYRLDSWLRMRLRSILRRRSGRRGVDAVLTIVAGRTSTLRTPGCFLWSPPGKPPVNPLGGKPPTGEPDAGNPHVRFGGRGGRCPTTAPTPIPTDLAANLPIRTLGTLHGLVRTSAFFDHPQLGRAFAHVVQATVSGDRCRA